MVSIGTVNIPYIDPVGYGIGSSRIGKWSCFNIFTLTTPSLNQLLDDSWIALRWISGGINNSQSLAGINIYWLYTSKPHQIISNDLKCRKGQNKDQPVFFAGRVWPRNTAMLEHQHSQCVFLHAQRHGTARCKCLLREPFLLCLTASQMKGLAGCLSSKDSVTKS